MLASARIKKALDTKQLIDWGEFFMRRITIFFILVIMGIPRLTRVATLDKVHIERYLLPMEALDFVKEVYATNFIKTSLEEDLNYYFYKLDNANYYLVYENIDDRGYYLFHQYEFVLDDMDTGIGHTVTYGWYWVNPYSGDMWEFP